MLKIITQEITSRIKYEKKLFPSLFLDLITIKHRLSVGSILYPYTRVEKHVLSLCECLRERESGKDIKAKRVQIMIIVIKIKTQKWEHRRKAYKCLCA